MRGVEVEESYCCPQKMAWDICVLLSLIMNDLGILKKWKVRLWWGLGEPLPWQSLREWWHSFVNLTSGRTKQKEIAKFLLITIKLGWFIPVRKDGQGHILYFIFCYSFSHVSEMVSITVIFYKCLQCFTCFTFVILHKSLEMPKSFEPSDR